MDRVMLAGLAKDWAIAFAIAAGVMGLWQLATPAPPSDGEAPPMELATTTGETWTLEDQAAPAMVVNFWATWCGPCKAEIPAFSAFARAHPEVPVIGVSVDENLPTTRLAAEAKRLGIDYTVLHDREGEVARAWGVNVYPTTFVLDKDHNIISMRVGAIDRTRLEEMVPTTTATASR